ncbi:phosphoribosylpyrophosphate synthetase [Mucilaginibacter sp. JRF]|uniref:phosphoribosylpyrophosphate synthetase n=1 Tax=Mucilaginibacter sp. JRF TaxID=2780088 RepID=UPI00187FA382|nr:phosphoribosylpyrophosphate synthetase [Mucilaginibacter sp. JRF]MBE9583422.1 phosphoribosylpyrophosphate synthetase [Mucilaginibacter sp. JRF]
MENYETLVDATNDLLKRGYTANLSMDEDSVNDKERGIEMLPDEFEIDEFYRFEGASNPSDTSIVYAISSEKYNLKGVLVNAYGVYADNATSGLIAKLHHNQVSEHLHGEDRPKA